MSSHNYGIIKCHIGTISMLYGYHERQIIGYGLRQLKHVQRPFVVDEIVKYFDLTISKQTMLEVGAGFDSSSESLAKSYGPSITILDKYENEWKSRSGKNIRDIMLENSHVKYILGLAGQPDEHRIPNNTFDCVYSVSVLEHVPKQLFSTVLIDIDRMLKPGGIQVHAIDFPVDRGVEPLKFYLDHFGVFIAKEYQSTLQNLDLNEVRSDPDTFYETPEIFKLYWGHGGVPSNDVRYSRWASLNLVLVKLVANR